LHRLGGPCPAGGGVSLAAVSDWRGYGIWGGAAAQSACQRGGGDDETGRGGRVRVRVDVRLARALAGDVRAVPADPGRDLDADRRADGDQPGDAGLVGDRVDVRD